MVHRPLPRLFALLFAAVMLLMCGLLGWYSQVQYALRFQVADVALSLDTSRQREAKQRYEYDQAAAELPDVQVALQLIQPDVEAVKAQEAELRQRRKTLRADNKDLAEQLAAAQADGEALAAQAEALAAEVEALRSLRDELLAQAADSSSP